MKNIHLIPTGKPSRLYYHNDGELKFISDINILFTTSQNLYITSDEEIKEDFKGWFIGQGEFEKKCVDTTIINNELYLIDWLGNTDRVIWCKKIILTTDQELINDGVQSIDNEFLEWFINNPSCESVEIEKLCQKEVISEWWESLSDEEMKEVFKQTGNFYLGGWGHDIGPTEEDVKDMYLEVHNLNLKKLNFNVYKIITPKENTKRETLEEAAESYAVKDFNYSINYDAFIEGAKWQSKIMYSDEDMVKFSSWILLQDITSRGEGNYVNTDGKIVTVKDLFEQFKKK